MFHLFSKILQVFLSPLVWVVILLLAGLLFPKLKAAKKLLVSGLVVLLLFSNPLLFRWAASAWEKPLQPRETVVSKAEILVVLGGLSGYQKPSQRIVFNASGDRLLQALDVFSEGKAKRIIISGGAGNLLGEKKPEALFLKDYLLRLGYADSLVVAESQSKNTAQNAAFTAELFQQHHWPKNIVLVTSAFHLRRATACFEKQGFRVVPYATDPLAGINPLTLADIFVPEPKTLSNWNLLLKEVLGMVTYRMMGYL